MPTEILMPALSPTMEDGTLAKWLVKEGDTVSAGDILAEIETDKATMEFEAVDEGVIGKILVEEGTEGVKVNAPIAVLLEEGESADDIAAPSDPAPEAPKAADAGAEAASDGGSEPPAPAAAAAATPTPAAPAASDGSRVFSPPRLRAASPGTRVSTSARSRAPAPMDASSRRMWRAPPPSLQPPPPPRRPNPRPKPPGLPCPRAWAPSRSRRCTRAATTRRSSSTACAAPSPPAFTEAKQTIPHFYLRRDIRLDALLKFRSQLNKQLEGRGVKLSVNDFIIKACANALQAVPAANAVWAGDRMLRLKPSDVAVAVAVDGGLFTPVLKDAHQKSLSALSAEMKGPCHARPRIASSPLMNMSAAPSRSPTSACSASTISTRSSTRPMARSSRSAQA